MNQKIALNELVRSSLLEMLATAVFVYFGTGSVLATGEFLGAGSQGARGVSSILPIAFSFGLTITVLVYGLGHLSGGHINPAVTLSLVLIGECEVLRGAAYFFAQLIGSVMGSLLLWGSTSEMSFRNDTIALYIGSPPFNLGANALNERLSAGNGFLLEFMGTFLLCVTVLMTVKHAGNLAEGSPTLAPLAIGLSIFLAHVVLIPFTGCGINPARSFGPAVVCSFVGKDVWSDHYWIYWIGPFSGALIAAALFTLLKPYQVKKSEHQVPQAASVVDEMHGAKVTGIQQQQQQQTHLTTV